VTRNKILTTVSLEADPFLVKSWAKSATPPNTLTAASWVQLSLDSTHDL
jgi:hypothetical protein